LRTLPHHSAYYPTTNADGGSGCGGVKSIRWEAIGKAVFNLAPARRHPALSRIGSACGSAIDAAGDVMVALRLPLHAVKA